jgi:hypothetical protein
MSAISYSQPHDFYIKDFSPETTQVGTRNLSIDVATDSALFGGNVTVKTHIPSLSWNSTQTGSLPLFGHQKRLLTLVT